MRNIILSLLLVHAVVAVGQEDTATRPSLVLPKALGGNWPLEKVVIRDGDGIKTIRGLILEQRRGSMDFVEIHRPLGRPMYAIVRPVTAEDVITTTRLSEKERLLLKRRLESFRNRVPVEAGQMDKVGLNLMVRSGTRYRQYTGNWFRLASTADDHTTRRSVVRIEQVFLAYRNVLPPRVRPKQVLQVLLLGSMDEYREQLTQRGLKLKNPAYFSSTENSIVAGSELTEFAARLSSIREHHEERRRQYKRLDQNLEGRLSGLANQLREAGFSQNQITAELKARRIAWEAEYNHVLKQLAILDRKNSARFAEVTQNMFTRLHHESFHAYLDNYVYPPNEYDVPRWLNEGLAQIFENGQLEVDTLRIDAPPKKLLAKLQRDLQGPSPLLLQEVLQANQRAFLGSHGDPSRANRLYLYAWGLAHYLTFINPSLDQERLDAYVSNKAAEKPAVPRFEQFVGQRLVELEPAWRAAMLNAK